MGLLSFLWGKPSPDQFAKKMAAALRAEGVEGEIVYDQALFALRFDGSMLNLGLVIDARCAATARSHYVNVRTGVRVASIAI